MRGERPHEHSGNRRGDRRPARNVWELLNGKKYALDYYDRDYKWEEQHIEDLINDLSKRFLDDYEAKDAREGVVRYNPYFLGSIVHRIRCDAWRVGSRDIAKLGLSWGACGRRQ